VDRVGLELDDSPMFWITFSAGTPIGRIVGLEAMNFGGWQRLNAEYSKQFGVETPNWPPQAARGS
jgi:hypothetical protein